MIDDFSSKILKTALEIVETARNKGIVVRILGAVAAYLHCCNDTQALIFIKNAGRLTTGTIFTDVDLIAYSKQRKQLVNLMRELNFDENKMINALFGYKRLLFFKDQVKVDVFFDKLEFSHDVFFGSEPGKGRLEIDYPTISLTDLMLEKLQIHQVNKKDIIDIIAILTVHEVGDTTEKEVINGKYIGRVLSDDWGFWYDALENLKKVEYFINKFREENLLSLDQSTKALQNIEKIRIAIENTEKTKKWIKRSKIGVSKPWYREVGDLNI
ncbi:MAG: hypothetical protein QXP57_08980 [Nitrososphaerota archaeon]|nr:hypothetical protein [Candidatus Geocrenenecus dongiae]